jgi:hypothetical protein
MQVLSTKHRFGAMWKAGGDLVTKGLLGPRAVGRSPYDIVVQGKALVSVNPSRIECNQALLMES